jgi:hypothetical protein
MGRLEDFSFWLNPDAKQKIAALQEAVRQIGASA